MKKHERILKSYKRNHHGENFEDTEKGKVSKEKHQVEKLEKKAKILLKKALATSEDNLMDEVKNISHQSKNVAGNLNTHKARLSELQKNDDFV